MTNEMKLITALCDLLEIDVEAVITNHDDIHNRMMIDVGSGENLHTYTPIPFEYEYKLTKREDVDPPLRWDIVNGEPVI